MRELTARQRQRTDTAARWTTANPVLLRGEIGYEGDTGRFKFGDGAARWTALPYRGGVATVNGAAPDASGNIQISAGGGSAHSLTVTTQEDFEAMAASPDWLGATSVLLCGAFTIPGTGGKGLTVPETVRVIDGAPGAEIRAEGDVDFVLQYEFPLGDGGRRVTSLTVRCLGTGGGFANLTHLTDCAAVECTTGFSDCTELIGCRADVTATGFSLCIGLTGCNTYIGYGSIAVGFVNCQRLTDCSAIIDYSAYGRAFQACQFLSCCTADVQGLSEAVCYNSCSYCTCCARGTMSANGKTWTGTTTKRCDATCDL